MRKVMCYTLFAILSATALESRAEPEKIFSMDSTGVQISTDNSGNFIYLPDQKNNALSIINTQSLEVENTILLSDTPVDIALDEQAGLAYVSLKNTPELQVLNLVSREITGSIALPQPAHEVVAGASYLYATPASYGNNIMRVAKQSQIYVDDFSEGVSVYYRGALELTPNKDRLVFGNRGLSPATLAVFDITGESPQLLIKNDHGALGSNGQNISVDPLNGGFASFAVGGGNGSGYTIAKLDLSDLTWQGEFSTGAYPRAIHYSSDGYTAYTNNSANEVKAWDSNSLALQYSFSVSGNPKDFIDLQDATQLAVIGDQEFAIYRVKEEQPAPVAQLEGRLTGSELYRAVCINHTTGQRVNVNLTGHYFDCIASGLMATAGDVVRVTLHATIE